MMLEPSPSKKMKDNTMVEQRCSACKEKLRAIPWSDRRETELLLCDNALCQKFRQPQEHEVESEAEFAQRLWQEHSEDEDE